MSPGPSEPGTSEAAGLDDLRRRLYGPDASSDDVARYRAASGEPAEGSRPPVSPPPRRRTPRPVVIAVVLVVAVGIAVGVLTAGRPAAAPTAAPSAGPASTATTSSPGIDRVPAPASVRAGFVRALASGGRAELLRYFFDHHDLLPPAILTVGRADSTEYAGVGPTRIALSPSALAERGGRVTVIVVLDRAGSYRWQATRVPVRQDRSGPAQVVATAGGGIEAGAPIAGTFGYGRGAPSRLSVRVAAGTRWGAVVVFTD